MTLLIGRSSPADPARPISPQSARVEQDSSHHAGEVSNDFTRSDVPANTNMTNGAAPGRTYVRVDVNCRGGATDSKRVIAPAS